MAEVTFSYDTRDFINAHRLAARAAWRERWLWGGIAVANIAGIGIMFFFADPQYRLFAMTASTILMPLLSVFGVWLIQRMSIAFFGSRSLKAQPALREEFTFEIQADGLLQRSKLGQILVRWEDLFGYSKDHSTWLLYPDLYRRIFYVLPADRLTPNFTKSLKANLLAENVPKW